VLQPTVAEPWVAAAALRTPAQSRAIAPAPLISCVPETVPPAPRTRRRRRSRAPLAEYLEEKLKEEKDQGMFAPMPDHFQEIAALLFEW